MKTDSAVPKVLAAFRRASLVALGERHWAREDAEFRLKLIRDPDFPWAAADIVVEFASASHQETLDRFVSGETVAPSDLRRIWRETGQPGAWESPVYENFLHAVREINAGLPPARRLRVLAGDPPPDGQSLWRLEDPRDSFAATVIENEVLRRGRKALVVFGALHLYRSLAGTIVDRLGRNAGARWFIVVPVSGPGLPAEIFARPASPSAPAWMRLNRDPAGRLPANGIFERGTMRVRLENGKPVLAPAQIFAASVEARQVADACLYFGAALPEFVTPGRLP
jgi:hypothetical protein